MQSAQALGQSDLIQVLECEGMGKPFELPGLFPHQKNGDVRPFQACLQGYCVGHVRAHTTEKVPADRLAIGASFCPSHRLTLDV